MPRQPRSGAAGGAAGVPWKAAAGYCSGPCWCWGQQLPGALQLLPQPGGQHLPHFVQELGELDVMVPVIVPQEGSRLQGEEKVEEG